MLITHYFKIGVIFVEGEIWREQRRFSLRHLRDLGFGKTSIEDHMMNEIRDLISDISSASKSDPKNIVDFKSIFSVSVINILWAIVAGERFERNDVKFKRLLSNVDLFLQNGDAVSVSVPVPAFLIRMFPSIPKWLGIDTELFRPLQTFIQVVAPVTF